MDNAQPEVTRVVRPLEIHLLTLQPDLTSRICLVNTGEYLHERRFTGAILTAESQDLAGTKVEVHIGQRLHTGEGLGDPLQLKQVRHFSPLGYRPRLCVRSFVSHNSLTLTKRVTTITFIGAAQAYDTWKHQQNQGRQLVTQSLPLTICGGAHGIAGSDTPPRRTQPPYNRPRRLRDAHKSDTGHA